MSTEPNKHGFVVNQSHCNPRSAPSNCWLCDRPIGQFHAAQCGFVVRSSTYSVWENGVRVGQYVTDEPDLRTKDQLEFHHNEGSWCASNLCDDAGFTGKVLAEKTDEGDYPCICGKIILKLESRATEARHVQGHFT